MGIKKFDMNNREMKKFGTIPAGIYLAEITDTEWKETNAKTGYFLSIEWTIQKGEHKNSKVWSTLNLDNPSEKAIEIAQDEYSTLTRAVGLKKPITETTKKKDKEYVPKLHKKRAMIEVELEPEKIGTKGKQKGKVISKPRNNIVFYESTTKGGKEEGGGAPWDKKDKKDKKKGKKKG